MPLLEHDGIRHGNFELGAFIEIALGSARKVTRDDRDRLYAILGIIHRFGVRLGDYLCNKIADYLAV